MLTLSKSDFKVAQSCVTKLYYKKKRYPTTNDGNEYMQLLAEGGYMVGKLAQLLYTNGIEITDDNATTAGEKTNALLQQQNVEIEDARLSLVFKAEQLEQSNKYKSAFLANMSHELRTPLNSILILAKLLADNKTKNLSDKQTEHATIIHKSGSDLLNLINEILDLSNSTQI